MASLPFAAVLRRHAWQDRQTGFPAFVQVHAMAQLEGAPPPGSLRCCGDHEHPDPSAGMTA
jgi:hypothetical protein